MATQNSLAESAIARIRDGIATEGTSLSVDQCIALVAALEGMQRKLRSLDGTVVEYNDGRRIRFVAALGL